ncbi:hypothetical protein Hanom_Chr15g01386581 [Helianthus anomalus]
MIIPIMNILHMFQLRIRKIPRLKYKIMYPFAPLSVFKTQHLNTINHNHHTPSRSLHAT